MNQIRVSASRNGASPRPASPPPITLKRTLKIQDVGDAWRRKVVPSLRLEGQWLSGAGFQPSQSVAVTLVSPGVLELRLVGEPRTDSEPKLAPVDQTGSEDRRIPSADVPFDFWVSDHGSLSLFHPQTHKARAWLKVHCPAGDEHQYWCGALAVESRFASGLLQHAMEDGLVVKL